MNKKAFTLIELLAVIAIIGILSILVVPNVAKIKQNSENRMKVEKGTMTLTAAELYAAEAGLSDGTQITVCDLLIKGYIESDSDNCTINGGTCSDDCVSILSGDDEINANGYITIEKKTVGYVASFADGTEYDNSSDFFVKKVCDAIKNEQFKAVGLESNETCTCNYDTDNNVTGISDSKACILVSNNDSGEINNWVKYGSDEANWRVLGIYNIGESGETKLSVKMVTSNVVD